MCWKPGTPPERLYQLRTTLKTWIKQETQREWEHSWGTETRGRACYRYTPKPTHKVLRLHENRSKRLSSLLIQMRTEKIGLRDFLHQEESQRLRTRDTSAEKQINGNARADEV
jgi:hypothetical protein